MRRFDAAILPFLATAFAIAAIELGLSTYLVAASATHSISTPSWDPSYSAKETGLTTVTPGWEATWY